MSNLLELIASNPAILLVVAAALGLGILLGYGLPALIGRGRIGRAQAQAQETLSDARKHANNIRREARLEIKDELYELRKNFDQETRSRKEQLDAHERRLVQKESNLDKKVDLLEKKESTVGAREREINEREKKLRRKSEELDVVLEDQKRRLQDISGLTVADAKKQLFAALENEAKREAAVRIKRIEEEAKEECERKARWMIGNAIQRYAGEHVSDCSVSVVNLPNDEMKGRIIGREGRNIRALEIATGIDIIVDDTPEAVILSGFDPVRREIARLTLERLVADGRIHPARIEEVLEKAKEDVDTAIWEAGTQAAIDANVSGIHSELIRLVGRLKYRFSYGQNVLNHVVEVSHLAGLMAGELGIDTTLARRCGLLHDIGKAMNHEVEGSHAAVGAEAARRFDEPEEVVNAAASHHGEAEASNIFSVLTAAADAVSAARPGARRETLENYIKRLEKLEQIADGFDGVEKTYAIQAGREIRVVVQPEKLNDAESMMLARDLSKKIEEECQYPGQIKITVLRETRAVEYAK